MKGKRKTHEEYVAEVAKIHPEYKVLSFYVDSKTKVKHQCGEGHVFWMLPTSVLSGRQCLECKHIHSRIPVEVMKQRLKEVWGDAIEYVCGYVNSYTKCWFKCKFGHVWKTRPYQVIGKKQGCPECYRLSRIIPLEEVKRRVYVLTDGMIEYVEGYAGTHKKCKWRCVNCNHIWETTPENIFGGNRCPCCIKTSMEEPVMKLLDKKKVIYLHDKPLEGCMSDVNGFLRFDFQIPTDKGLLIIETDGQQHFVQMRHREKLERQQEKDAIKNKFCKDNGIPIIRVTSSHKRKWGTPKHLTLSELFNLLDVGIDENGNVDLDVFRPYDFNRE